MLPFVVILQTQDHRELGTSHNSVRNNGKVLWNSRVPGARTGLPAPGGVASTGEGPTQGERELVAAGHP